MATEAIKNEVSIIGKYLLIKRLGKSDVYFSQKNTIMNVTNDDTLTISETYVGGKISISKIEVDLNAWGTKGLPFTWDSCKLYFAENTSNFVRQINKFYISMV